MEDHPVERPAVAHQPADQSGADNQMSPQPAETVEQLRAEVERYKSEAEQNWQQFLRTAADLENYKKQAARQREEAVQRARNSVLTVVLTVADNLERALEHVENGDRSDAVLEGIRMTYRQVLDLLTNMGIRPIEAVGRPFDPKIHEAVDVASARELGVDPGTVVGEVQRGYTLPGEVLRPARVRVAK